VTLSFGSKGGSTELSVTRQPTRDAMLPTTHPSAVHAIFVSQRCRPEQGSIGSFPMGVKFD